ncbi:hypothetical protein G7046_g2234 [Stylonectria norvegica]|nr:hypothetical protein G7046_g2234 [Stylonectria norvegica]
MKAYFYDNLPGDQRLPHNSGQSVQVDDLVKLGVHYYHLPDLADVDKLAAERGYRNRDEITVSPEKMGDVYEDKVKMFFHEHLHEDEEIRYIRDGQGYFDVRSKDDAWVRVQLDKDDLLILPAGIYHRFTTDESNYVKAMRLFKDEPKWTALNRGPELNENDHRQEFTLWFCVLICLFTLLIHLLIFIVEFYSLLNGTPLPAYLDFTITAIAIAVANLRRAPVQDEIVHECVYEGVRGIFNEWIRARNHPLMAPRPGRTRCPSCPRAAIRHKSAVLPRNSSSGSSLAVRATWAVRWSSARLLTATSSLRLAASQRRRLKP